MPELSALSKWIQKEARKVEQESPNPRALGTRINVVGCSGSGKTTLARSLADLLNLPFVELDSFQHQAGWKQASREEFLDQVHAATQGDRWVVDGNYSVIRPTIWPRVETIIWLDHSFATCFSRVWRRTFRRWLRREVLWNGNREHILHHFFTRDSLLLWVIRTHRKKRSEIAGLFASGELRGKNLIRFSSPDETELWLSSLNSLCESSTLFGSERVMFTSPGTPIPGPSPSAAQTSAQGEGV